MNTRIFSASLIWAALLCPAPLMAQAARPGTEDALRCLLRRGPDDCRSMFVGPAWATARGWVFDNPNRDFKRGDLLSSSYFGAAAQSNVYDARVLIRSTSSDMDIFDVKFAHIEYSIYISPAAADGKIHDVAIKLYAPHDMDQLAVR